MFGRNPSLQALVRKARGHPLYCNRQAIASRNMSAELQSVLNAIIGVVNYVKKSPLRERFFATLCDDREAEHSETGWLCPDKLIHRVFELKEEMAPYYVMMIMMIIIIIIMTQVFKVKLVLRNRPMW
jgi:hypothetical protein